MSENREELLRRLENAITKVAERSGTTPEAVMKNAIEVLETNFPKGL